VVVYIPGVYIAISNPRPKEITMSKPEITVLHGTDGKYHLFDRCKNKACDWPPCDTRMQAEVEAKAMIADLQQLR
jgi:hypothetical protein